MTYKLQTSLNYLSNSVNTFYIINARVCVHADGCRQLTRWTGNEYHGRLIRARNELEFLLISQPERDSPAPARNSHEDLAPKSKLCGYWIYEDENSVREEKKRTRCGEEARWKSASQLKVIKLIGPWDNQANYRYQSTIAPRRCAAIPAGLFYSDDKPH